MFDIKNLANEITKQLSNYSKDVEKKLKQAENKVTNEGVKKLKQDSPKDTGEYADGWGKSKVNGKTVVHNKTNGQLTHLLEKGHAKVGGGRVPAQVHIRPVEEKVVADFIKLAEEAARP